MILFKQSKLLIINRFEKESNCREFFYRNYTKSNRWRKRIFSQPSQTDISNYLFFFYSSIYIVVGVAEGRKIHFPSRLRSALLVRLTCYQWHVLVMPTGDAFPLFVIIFFLLNFNFLTYSSRSNSIHSSQLCTLLLIPL